MATQQEVIYNFMQSLDNTELKGEKALDEAIRASSNFKSFNALKKQFLADLKGAKSWHRFLVEKCGIILDNTDTGAISGADCGGATIKTSTDILPSEGKAKYPSGTSFTVDGLTIYGIPPKSTLTKDQQYVVRNLYSWWIRDALKQIKESYSFSFDEENTTNARLKLEFIYDEDNDGLAYVSHSSDDGKHHESRVLCVNMARFQNMSSADRHGTISNNTKSSLDRTLIHELTHGIMASNINYFDNLPFFFIEGGSAELIHGVDDERADEIIECAKNPTVFKNILIPINFDEPSYEVYAGGYMFMRYFAKQAATDTKFD